MPLSDWFSPPSDEGGGAERPHLPGVFGFLDDLLHSIRDTFDGWVDNLRDADGNVEPDASTDWVDLGRLINAAHDTYYDADEELEDDDYPGFRGATAFDDESEFDLYYEPPGDDWDERKTFASYLDVLNYMADIMHLESRVVYDGELYTIYIRDSP